MINTISTPISRTPSVEPGTLSSPPTKNWEKNRLRRAANRPGVGREAKKSSIGVGEYITSEVMLRRGLKCHSILTFCHFFAGPNDEIYYNCATCHMNTRSQDSMVLSVWAGLVCNSHIASEKISYFLQGLRHGDFALLPTQEML